MPRFSIVVEVHTVIEVDAPDLEAAQTKAEVRVTDALLESAPLPGSPELQDSWGDEMG